MFTGRPSSRDTRGTHPRAIPAAPLEKQGRVGGTGVAFADVADPALELEDLTRDFGRRRAVDSVSLRVEPGEIIGFLGPNGAGKTTTIRMLLGLARPTRGDVRIHGVSVVRDRVRALDRVGALVENAAIHEHLTAEQNLRAAAFYVDHPPTPSMLSQLLAQVGLADRARDRAAQFSRGMKQRLALAVALLGNPRLLVLDEPTDGLDPIGTVEIRNLLSRLRGEGTTIFMSSHLLSEVQAVCDRVAILVGGRLRALGTVASLTGDRSLEEYFMGIAGASASR